MGAGLTAGLTPVGRRKGVHCITEGKGACFNWAGGGVSKISDGQTDHGANLGFDFLLYSSPALGAFQ